MADPALYQMLMNAPNAGQAFANAFNQGMQQNALSQFAMNPNDPNAQGAAARYDPGAVMQYRLGQQRQQTELSAEEHKQWTEYAGSLAKWADTPEKWDQAVDYLVQSGHPEAAQLKGHFSPALRQSFMAQAGLHDDQPTQDPGIIREYDIALQRQMIPAGTTFEQYVAMRNPGAQTPVIIPNNVQQVGGGQAGPITATGPNGQRIQFNPQTNQWEPMGGGASNGTGGFPQ